MDYTHTFIPTNSSENLTKAQSDPLLLNADMLNSERIKTAFGSYNIEIIDQDENTRISNLFSTQPDTTRTLSVVHFLNKGNSIWHTEHQKILDGQSIGQVFKKNHWEIDKQSKFFGQLKDTPMLSFVYEKMQIIPNNLCIHIYDLWVQKESNKSQYALIAELHHPQYLQLGDLRNLYLDFFDKHLSMCNGTTKIWENISCQLHKLP